MGTARERDQLHWAPPSPEAHGDTMRAPVDPPRKDTGGLRVLNLVVGFAHAGQAAAMLALSSGLALPVTAAFLKTDPVVLRRPTRPETLFSLPIGATVALFLGLAAADHLLVAAPGVHRWYERRVADRRSEARWIEYSLSASVMMVLIGLFVGIHDVAAVAGLFVATSAMILFGLLMERQQSPGRPDWSAFAFGSLVGAAPWVLVFVYVAGAPTVPGFVWAIVVSQLLLFASFAVNMALQYRAHGRWMSYVFGERVFIGLSLVAKSLLAWLVYANVLRT